MNIKHFIAPLVTALFTAALVIFPNEALEAAKNAYIVCENTVIPSLFPFFVCSNLLTSLNAAEYLSGLLRPVMRPIFGVSENSALAVIMGIVSGYPVGAKTAAALKEGGYITKSEAEKLLAFCNNSGPLFILGAVGSGMLFDRKAGFVLYAAHILAAATAALAMRGVKCDFINPKEKSRFAAAPFGTLLNDGIAASVTTVYTISGFVVVFAILLKFAELFGIISLAVSFGFGENIAKCIICGLVEPTNGCIAASRLDVDVVYKCMIISSVIGWSGISVHLQVAGTVKKYGLSLRYYFCGKIISALLSPVYTFVIFKLIPNTAFLPHAKRNAPFEFTVLQFAVPALIIALLSVLYKTTKRHKNTNFNT